MGPTGSTPPFLSISLFNTHSILPAHSPFSFLPWGHAEPACLSQISSFSLFLPRRDFSPSEWLFVPSLPQSNCSMLFDLPTRSYYAYLFTIILLIYWFAYLLQLLKWAERHKGEIKIFPGKNYFRYFSSGTVLYEVWGLVVKRISFLLRNPMRWEKRQVLLPLFRTVPSIKSLWKMAWNLPWE